jgi:hypothetical protein
MNAMAHPLQYMFYILGAEVPLAEEPATVTAELYRANPITNHDTAAIRCRTRSGASILFYASHAVDIKEPGPLVFTFEKGLVRSEGAPPSTPGEGDPSLKPRGLVGTLHDGTTRDYGEMDGRVHPKLIAALEAVRTGSPVVCGIEASRPHIACINAAQDSRPEIVEFPKSMVRVMGEPGHRVNYVPGLADVLKTCCEKNLLPSELGVEWARPGREIDVRGYEWFPGGRRPSGKRSAK